MSETDWYYSHCRIKHNLSRLLYWQSKLRNRQILLSWAYTVRFQRGFDPTLKSCDCLCSWSGLQCVVYTETQWWITAHEPVGWIWLDIQGIWLHSFTQRQLLCVDPPPFSLLSCQTVTDISTVIAGESVWHVSFSQIREHMNAKSLRWCWRTHDNLASSCVGWWCHIHVCVPEP